MDEQKHKEEDFLPPDGMAPPGTSEAILWPGAEMHTVISAEKFLDEMEKAVDESPSLFSPVDRLRIKTADSVLGMLSPIIGKLWVSVETSSLPPRFSPLINRLIERGWITGVNEVPSYNDEPPIFLYNAAFDVSGKTSGDTGEYIQKQMAGKGVDLDPALAMLKAVAEAVERSVFLTYRKSDIVFSKPAGLTGARVHPSQFRYFSPSQLGLPRFKKRFLWNEDSIFGWVKGKEWHSERPTWIPAQMIFWNYDYPKDESHLWIPITNGAACGSSFHHAITNAMCELIERDAFLIRWIRNMVPPRIDHGKMISEKECRDDLRILIGQIEQCRLKLHLLDIRLDFDIPTVAAVIVDESGVGPAVTVGGGCHPDWQIAIKKAVCEVLHVRYAIRGACDKCKEEGGIFPADDTKAYESDLDRPERFLFWAKTSMIEKIKPFISGEYLAPTLHSAPPVAENVLALYLARLFRQNKCSLYVYDASPAELKQMGFWTVRAISPELMPLYLHEEFPYLGVPRLYDVPRKLGYKIPDDYLNPLPHPYP